MTQVLPEPSDGDAGKPLEAMVVYAHDRISKEIVRSLVPALVRRNVKVIYDRDLKLENVPSLPEWMESSIEKYPVVCVLSIGFVRGVENDGECADGKGRLFERRLLYRKYYQHTDSAGCPIIPVALREFDADSAGPVFGSISIVRFDPATEDGAEEIVRRLRNLGKGADLSQNADPAEGARPASDDAGEVATRPVTAIPDLPCALREIVRDLEAADPSSDSATLLVREWLAGAETPGGCPLDFTRGFPAVERIVRMSGDAELMSEVTHRCLDALRDVTLLRSDKRAKAMILICGLAWLLRRHRELPAALAAVREGIGLARECDDPWVVALGKACAGHIHRELAEDAELDARGDHLRQGIAEVTDAITLFTAAEEGGTEIGICLHVLAHLQFSQFPAAEGPHRTTEGGRLRQPRYDRLAAAAGQ